jgi:two-component system, chemotaxis family, sensor kinase Cph1
LAVPRPLSPAFGTADLSNCEREQIHLAGSIQPHGALLVLRESDQTIVQASENAAAFLGVDLKLQGARVRALGGDLWERTRMRFPDSIATIPMAAPCQIGKRSELLNTLLHRTREGELVVEIEHGGGPADYSEAIESAVQSIIAATALQALCDEAARIFKELTGYDRVMVYRFDEAGHGEVFSETRKPDLEALLGNRYPASDIPQIARRLYERNRVRLLADVNYEPAGLFPRLSPISGKDLDMSLCFLRSASPIHVQYLKNMGVGATLVVSLMVAGRLWGLISCHHYAPRFLHFEMRAVCELLAEVVATRIAALESFARGQGELAARRLEQRMVEWVSRDGDWRGALFDRSRPLLLPLGATGVALIFEGEVTSTGDVPGTDQIREIARWINPKLQRGIFSTSSLGADEPAFAPLAGLASGVAAVRISGQDDEMLIWFRLERVRTVTWGGNPFKPPSPGDDPSELSPRRSFAQWHQVVEGTSDPWTAADLTAARLIGASVTDVIVQFRAVRILMAQDQLEQVLRQVRNSDQQVVVADAHGRVLENTAAFSELFAIKRGALVRIDELAEFFADPEDARRKLMALIGDGQPWRGEAKLENARGETRSVLVRADPVLATPARVLGFVLLFTDLTDRKAAEAARRRFQDGIVRSHRKVARNIDSQPDLRSQNLMSAIIENAQLAALEITDGTDVSEMPGLLESVRVSVARTAEVLEQLALARNDSATHAVAPDRP